MASTIVTKNSSTASAVPVAGDLTKGELAVNVTDKKLYTKDNGGSVVKLVGSLGNQEASAVAITGGTVDGTVIGGTTAAAGSFSTLNASGTTTFSGGTANGVGYLNGSKQFTTGSALTFDGTNLGIGVALPKAFISLNGGSNGTANSIRLYDDGSVTGSTSSNSYGMGFNSGDGRFSFTAGNSGYFAWFTSNSEQMRLTSTGLGIGTSSPGAKLAVSNGTQTAVINPRGTASGGLAVGTDVASSGHVLNLAGDLNGGGTGGGVNIAYYSSASSTWNAALQIRNTASTYSNLLLMPDGGNLGLGVTPSAWYASSKAFQTSAGSLYTYTTDRIFLGQNIYIDATGADKYAATGYASTYRQLSGAHTWYTAPSGTAGSAISFTQAMTLDASGRLLVGTTSDVAGGGYFGAGQFKGSYPALVLQGTEASAKIWQVGENAGALTFYNTTDGERARIDSSGNLLVGTTTSSGAKATFVAADTTSGTINAQQPNSAGGTNYTSASVSTSSTNWYHFVGQSGNGSSITTNNIFIYGNGNIVNANNSYGAISDLRLKENVTDATPKLDDLMKVRVVNYKLKSQSDQKHLGVIAQELEQVFPGMVEEALDRDAEGELTGETTKSVKYSVFVPMLIKAMQEQQAIIEQLTARVAQLEGK